MICPNCGNQLPKAGAFCPCCGYKAASVTPTEKPVAPPKAKEDIPWKKILLIAGCVTTAVLVLVLVFCAGSIFQSIKDSKQDATVQQSPEPGNDDADLPPATEDPTTEPPTTEAPTTQPATEAPTTQPSTEPPTTQPPATKPVVTSPLATSGIQRRINLFLSNFAEQGFDHYPASDSDLLHFGFLFCKYNRPNTVLYTDSVRFPEDAENNYYSKYYIKKGNMDTALKDFFGKTVSHDSSYEVYPYYSHYFHYSDNAYYFPAADGEWIDYVAVASKMTKNSDGTYNVEFDIYNAEYGLIDSYYDLTAEKAAKSGKLSWEASGSAVVRDATRSNGKKSYHLIRYELN